MTMGARIPSLSANLGQSCYTCFREENDGVTLSRCSACKRISYCGPACQRANWASHKKLCKAWQSVANDAVAKASLTLSSSDEPSTDFDTSNIIIDTQAQNTMEFLRVALGRTLTIPERNLVGWEPRCLACRRTDRQLRAEIESGTQGERHLLQPCPDCRTSFFCSLTHWNAVRAAHAAAPSADSGPPGLSQCALNRQIRQDLAVATRSGDPEMGTTRWAPNRQKPAWESIVGKNMLDEFVGELRATEAQGAPEAMIAPFIRAASEGLSMPMTIMWALEVLHGDEEWTHCQELVVHVVGAASKELTHSMAFEEILHRLPSVQRLRLVMCGPEIGEISPEAVGQSVDMDVCPSCSRADRRRIQEHLLNSQLCTVELTPSRTYDEFVRTPAYSIPHLAVAFNSGCSQNDTLSWESTIRMLVAQGTPTVFTACNRDEAEAEALILAKLGAKLVPSLGPCKNPWGSLLAQPEPNKVTGFYVVNGCLAGGFK